jgi:hypothetical protein
MPRFHSDGSLPQRDEHFVFGSNLAGRHGKGAAKQALRYGARYGRGIGFCGQTYAIPTKNASLRTLHLDQIRTYVDQFLEDARRNPELKFFVTRIGCRLAGYRDKDVAPLFAGAPENCSFAEEWRPYLDSQPTFIIEI